MRAMRSLWIIAGLVSMALGVIGAFLPLLPTVPFLLLAAACFARGSERLHDWLMAHPRFGPPIADWRDGGAISSASKRAALVAIALSFAIPFALGAALWVVAIQAVALGAVAAFILTRPGGPLF